MLFLCLTPSRFDCDPESAAISIRDWSSLTKRGRSEERPTGGAPPKGSNKSTSWPKTAPGGGNEPANTASLADSLSYAMMPKPFKDEKVKKGPRRNKPLKQILAAERLRAKHVSDLLLKHNPSPDEDVEMSATTAPDGQSNPSDHQQQSLSQPVVSKRARRELLGPVNPDVNYNSYMIIEAPPSAPYLDPKTQLRYHNAEVYELIRTFGPGLDQSYLSLRGAHITLR
ncbi:hypothetical protein VP01_887g15 [Puccinia sorghi]|uniref:Vps72/YL1 C-terminal domain-containing protein n=1 Tax=Puccinia sorghi TaxID=27349 RepID=A0A0L6UAC8_9BASI|nr:hypothetical protein VP01_887g15 [Puccinia sorghi]